jgi:hypothetical protein
VRRLAAAGELAAASCGSTAGLWTEQVVDFRGTSCGLPQNKLWTSEEQVVETHEQPVDTEEEVVDIAKQPVD